MFQFAISTLVSPPSFSHSFWRVDHPIRTLHSIPSESSRIFGHWISQDRIRTLFTICTISLTNQVLKSLIRTAYERRSFFFAILPLVSPTARGLAKPLQAQAQPSASCRRVFWPRSEQARACACATDGGCRSRWRQDTRDRPTREEVSYVKTAASRGALSNKREAPSLDPRSLFFLLDPTNTNGALQIGADQRSFLVTM